MRKTATSFFAYIKLFFVPKVGLVVFLMLCLISISKAQILFEEGYYVDFKNDSTFGLFSTEIDDSGNVLIFFKETDDSGIELLDASRVKSVQYFNSIKYISNQFGVKIEPERDLFIEVLVEGKANLYFLEGGYYLIKSDDVPVLLNWRNILPRDSVPNYPGLNVILSDCPKFKNKSSINSFDHPSLIGLVNGYNKSCDPKETAIHSTKYFRSKSLLGVDLSYVNYFSGRFGTVNVSNGDLEFVFRFEYQVPIRYNRFRFGLGIGYREFSFDQTTQFNYSQKLGYYESQVITQNILFQTILTHTLLSKKFDMRIGLGLKIYMPFSKTGIKSIAEIPYGDHYVTVLYSYEASMVLAPSIRFTGAFELPNKNEIGVFTSIENLAIKELRENVSTFSLGLIFSYAL